MASILLIDDDVDFSAFLKASLTRGGHRVDCLQHARGACERLEESSYDLVLPDNRMPGIHVDHN